MKHKWKIGLAAVCAVVLAGGIYAAAAGTGEDPLVTLSYLRNIFTGQVQGMIDTSVAAGQEVVRTEFDTAMKDWDSKVGEAVKEASESTSKEAAIYTAVTLNPGQTLTAQAGCQFIIRSGSAVYTASGTGGLVDQTDGKAVASNGKMTVNHLYLSDSDMTLSIPPQASPTGVIEADLLNVRSGPGGSNKRVGQLPKGTKVTILGEENGWYQVAAGEVSGYVSGEYVKRNEVKTYGPAELMVRGSYTVQ